MKVNIFITIKGKIDSFELYEVLKGYGMNVTDLIDKTLIYATCSLEDAISVIGICSAYGDFTAEVKHYSKG